MNASLYNLRFWLSVFTLGHMVRQESVERGTYKLLGHTNPSVADERPRHWRRGVQRPATGGVYR